MAASAAFIAASVAGCSSSDSPDRGDQRTSASPDSSRSGRGYHELNRRIAPLAGKGTYAWANLALTSDGAVYAVSSRGVTTLMHVRLASGESEPIARLAKGWVIQQVEVSGDRVVWVEKDHEQLDPLEPIAWRIRCSDVDNGSSRTLLRSRGRTPLAPGIGVHGDLLVHSRYRGLDERTTDLHSIDLRTGKRRLIAAAVRAGPFTSDGRYVISSVTQGYHVEDLVAYGPGGPKVVTATGDAQAPQYEDGHLVWIRWDVDHRYSVMVEEWPSERRKRVLYRQDDASPSLGDGYVVDLAGPTDERTSVIPIDNPSDRLLLRSPRGERPMGYPVASGDRIAWLSSPGGRVDTTRGHLVVVRVAPAG